MSEAFEKAEKLIQAKPMPDDVIEQLDELMVEVDIGELPDFMWLYEAAELEVRDNAK
jgi:hypothetical protein